MEIDVSKCVHYHDGSCGNDNTMFECCSKNNCIYKQLQQLKAELQAYKDKVKPVTFVDSDEYLKVVVENKQLKAENEGLQSLNDFNVQKIETLEAENEELRKEKDKYYQMTLDDEIQLNNLYQELQKESDLGHKAICEEMDSFFEVMKLQKVLDEIEGIVEQYSNNGIELSIEKQEQILQLIKQAKEGK